MKLTIDPEFSALIPPLSKEEYQQLEENLLAEGCRDALIAWGSILVDGHNRLEICLKHNIPFEVIQQDFPDREYALKYIILNQFGRRNLSVADRSLLALKLEPLYRAKAKDNQRKSLGRGKKGSQKSENLFEGIDTIKRIGEVAGVSHDTIAKVRRIVEEGTQQQVERIKEGGTGNSVSAVYKEVRQAAKPAPAAGRADDLPVSRPDPVGSTPREECEADAGAVADAHDAINIPTSSQTDETPPLTEQDELDRIRGYVAELKNPNLNRLFTTDMFLAEYDAFVQRFIRSIGAFDGLPYSEIYPILSAAEREHIQELGKAMMQAVRRQNQLVKE